MAGGPNAAVVMCMYCLEAADRTSEGLEDDAYTCRACRRHFLVDWSEGPPAAPAWPPSAEMRAQAQRWLAIEASPPAPPVP